MTDAKIGKVFHLSCSLIHSAIARSNASPLCFLFSSPKADFDRWPRYGFFLFLPPVAVSTQTTFFANNRAGKPKPRRPGGKTNDLLDALTRAQIELAERMNTLTRDVAVMGMRHDQAAMLLAVNAEQIKALIEQVGALLEAQARTDRYSPGARSGADCRLAHEPR
jgi:hypothetical protein